MQPHSGLWKNHVANCAHNLVEQLSNSATTQQPLEELTISKDKYKMLKRYHQKHPNK